MGDGFPPTEPSAESQPALPPQATPPPRANAAWGRRVQAGAVALVALVVVSAGVYLGSSFSPSSPTIAIGRATRTAGRQASATGARTSLPGHGATPGASATSGASATARPGATADPTSPGGSKATPTPTATLVVRPTATATPTPPPATVPGYSHVYLIVMENTWYGSVVGSGAAPYLNNTLIPSGALATRYYSLGHPSAPNYWALTSGQVLQKSNCPLPPTGPTTPQCLWGVRNLGDELNGAGLPWSAYYEDMPQDCYADHNSVPTAPNGYTYTPNYNPWINYTDVNPSRCADDVPFPANGASGLASAVSGQSFAMIEPNLLHDMHSGANPINAGDAWLGQYVPAIQQSAGCAQSCLIIITWDEDDSNHNNQVATIMWGSAHVPAGRKDATTYNHYSLLHTIERALGVGTLTANDQNAPLMAGMFS